MRLTCIMSCAVATAIVAGRVSGAVNLAPAPWHLAGDLSESCSCAVPCSCNFGESPSPHPFCWALFSLDIKHGSYGTVSLDGLRLAGGGGKNGMVFYTDSRATPTQEAALQRIGHTLWWKAARANGVKSEKNVPPDFRLLGYRRAAIRQDVGPSGVTLLIGDHGGFDANYIMGLDGKTPVTVQNNWSWNITNGAKAKSKRLYYKDGFGNKYEFKDTNANQGAFDWSDQTPIYFR